MGPNPTVLLSHHHNHHRKGKPFFRKGGVATATATPPVTPSSDDTNSHSSTEERRRRRRHGVASIDIPVATTPLTVSSAFATEDESSSSLKRTDSGVSDLTGVASTTSLTPTTPAAAQQDPPARILRTASVEAAHSTSSQSGAGGNGGSGGIVSHSRPSHQQQPPPQPHQSLVTKVLGIVDLSCVSTGLMLDDDEDTTGVAVHRSALLAAAAATTAPMPSRPEWGVAPHMDDDASGSSSSMEPLERAAGGATAPHEPPMDDAPNNQKRHESFELVYQETPPSVARKETAARRHNLWRSLSKQLFPHKMPETASAAAAAAQDECDSDATRAMLPKSLEAPASNQPKKPHWRLGRRSKSHSPVRLTLAKAAAKMAAPPSSRMDHSPPPHAGRLLEPVPEEMDDETTSVKVRVPGVEIADSFISDRDLIGSEVVDELYFALDEAIALEAQEQTRREEQQQEHQRELAQTVHPPEPVVVVVTESAESIPPNSMGGKSSFAGYREFVDSLSPQPPALIPAPKTWKRRLGLTKASEVAMEEIEPVAPTMTVSTTTARAASDKRKKAVWKPAVDPATGRTYYFHKKTRVTTWTKPPDEEIFVSKSSVKATAKQKREKEGATPGIVQKEPGDLDSILWETKQEVASSPPAESGAHTLVSGLDGRNEERTTQLHMIAESKPFDEPVQTSDDHPDDEKKNRDENCLLTRSRTGMSIYSGFSGRYSHKSRISELTQQIKNTSSNKPTLPALPDQSHSLATSISTKLEELPSLQATSMQTTTKIPKNIPVPRLRELNVEEFTTSDRVYGVRGTLRTKPARPGQDTSAMAIQPEDKDVVGDDEDNDADKSTVSYAATDSISALSEADLSFLDRKEASDDARRRALDRAISQEDWDLAAQLSESMRNNSKLQPQQQEKIASRETPGEWTQSEMDRFISDNDWEAMTAYIARLRASATEAGQIKMRKHLRERSPKEQRGGRGRPAAPSNHSDTSGASNPQKRFGARSQLQHDNLPLAPSTADSYSSYSSTYDSEYTSESYDNYDDKNNQQPTQTSRQRQPKAFAC